MADVAATIQIITMAITETITVTAVESSTVTVTASSIANLSSWDLPFLFQFSSFTASLVGVVVAIVATLAGWTIWDWRRKSEKIIVNEAAKKAADLVVGEATEKVLKIILPRIGESAKEETKEDLK